MKNGWEDVTDSYYLDKNGNSIPKKSKTSYLSPWEEQMTCRDVLNKYVWHDSLVEILEYSEVKKNVLITIEFGNWRQADYAQGNPETSICKMEFVGVTDFSHEPQRLEYNEDEILSLEVADLNGTEKIKLVLRGNFDTKMITFISDGVLLKFN